MREKSIKRLVVAGASLALVGGGVGGAIAATSDTSPEAEQAAFLADAAGRLGVQPSKLEDALKQAALDQVDAAVKAGRLTQGEANEIKARISSGDLGPGVGVLAPRLGGQVRIAVGLDTAASYLGLSDAQLKSELQSGKTLAQIAQAQGKSVDGLKQALLTDAKTHLDQALTDGKITAAQEQQMLNDLSSRLDDIVNGTLPPKPPWGGPPPIP
jgi:hypothetical protein